jgi:hypothetical protein
MGAQGLEVTALVLKLTQRSADHLAGGGIAAATKLRL